ncbi:choline/ethanolamine kinase family protein [Oharaeibacter diazotrophicus]|uniref:Thiamine kinase-like enzyme n=1 Tax=Oharaeibacter diazotrophicus TaxID=1920512 RepID=A0A4R6RK49_9HYPH|nr:choline/ethanolamine kinase family protein [Oharaeibacter diazotrophicus]TDP86297.1 thiamine kinase-like enzyme [Oharaeibacter diazotrophicus]BBE71760.1 choline/ethanolamine kinase [Pleomorphomonas sp. SM30]GLS78526.1 choline/ethanolamine kinase [Oharaeibacter diazotrophicus]
MADDIIGTDEAEALATFGGLGLVPAGTPATARRLGGLTNRVFRIEAGGTAFCLRLAGAGTEEYIDRGREAEMARLAAAAGVSPEVLAVDPATGVMVTRFLDGVATMTPAGFADRAGAPARAGRVFRQLHDGAAAFPSRFELFQMIDDYLRILSTKTVDLPEGYFDVLKEAETVKAALSARPLPLASCHCDPLCENFLDTGERMWLVDWEYGGTNDPMWDLGDLSVEGAFSPEQDEEMLAAYFPAGPTPAERGRMVIYKAMCDLLWTLWGLIQHANGNPADDFAAYAAGRFARCRALMATTDFAGHVAAVARG